MASRRIDDLNALDWDDSALIKAYNKGMSLQVKEFEEENSKEKRKDSKKNKWRTGDFCRAVYPHDNLEYEAKIVELKGGTCIVDFLGYNEEVEVDIDTLSKSHGKHIRKKQIRRAKDNVSVEESISGDDSSYSEDRNSHHHHQRNVSHYNHLGDNSANYTAAESHFQHTMYPARTVHCNNAPAAMMPPPPLPPPMLPNSDMVQNPSLCAMLSSWYMAGYYTGLHQGQKSRCQAHCCQSVQNCCH